ncbi:MAG: endolytic transglycosylase MltG [Bacteroidales bacterium]|nr:endolytic transglycosylase MltG [Bacteroidales bacterium]
MKPKKTVKLLFLLFILGFAAIGGGTYIFFAPNAKSSCILYIPKGASYQQVLDSVQKKNLLRNKVTFQWSSKILKYVNQVKCGKYEINEGENNRQIINRLRKGQHYPVTFTFNNIRTKEQLVEKTQDRFFFDSNDLLTLLNDSIFLTKYGFTLDNCIAGFIPNTYEIFYDISAEEFYDKMNKLYTDFWNEERLTKAEEIGLSPIEVSTLASIVEEENHRNKEKAIIAGLYINRLQKGMNLCADPTVKYAVGDFSLKRILNEHLKIDSPYNTYKYPGLPPGPIRIPEISSIDSVLHYTHHNYLYMCAKEDFSGYHNFAASAQQHAVNAAKYHRALNRR